MSRLKLGRLGSFGIENDGIGRARRGSLNFKPGMSRSIVKLGSVGSFGNDSEGIGSPSCGSRKLQDNYMPIETPLAATRGTEAGPPGLPVIGPSIKHMAGLAAPPPKTTCPKMLI